MMETNRLNWLRKKQSKLRVGKYHKLRENAVNPNKQTNAKNGKRVVLPSTFIGRKRYMDQLYFDGMAISSAVGFPDLFLTFTCNPNWPEITRELAKYNLKPHDRPDVILRVFKIKFDELMVDITWRHILKRVLACEMFIHYFITFCYVSLHVMLYTRFLWLTTSYHYYFFHVNSYIYN